MTAPRIAVVYDRLRPEERLLFDAFDAAGATTATVRVSLGVGSLRVLLPSDVTVTLDVELGIGRMSVPGRDQRGLGLAASATVPADGDAPATAPTLVLEVEQGIGRLRIDR